MTKKEVICIAKPTWYIENMYRGYKQFYVKFSAQLREYHEVRELELPDIWVRDFLPVQNGQTGKLFQLFFDPHYANYTPKFTDAIRRSVRGYFPQAKPCATCMDGGNIVLTSGKQYAICLEKPSIFHPSNLAQKARVEEELTQALGVREILWLPQQKGDKIGHIDGYVQALGDLLLFGNLEVFNGLTTSSLLDSKAMERLQDYTRTKTAEGNWLLEELPCRIDEEDWLSARGLYVNFLETSRAVFVPQFDLPEDEEIISIMNKCTGKPLVRVDCSKIAQYGGAVHCLTREYYE